MDVQQCQQARRPRRGPLPVPRFKITIRSCVALHVMAARGWQEVAAHYDWDIFWRGPRLLLRWLAAPPRRQGSRDQRACAQG